MNDLELATSKHKYAFGGPAQPSVTAITGLIDNGKAGAMAGAAAKITREGGNYREQWRFKADRGTRAHNNMDDWIAGRATEVLPTEAGFLDAGEKYLIENPHEWLHTERVIIGNGWGGRMDAIGRIPDGRVAIRDWKTGRQYIDHLIQISAYAHGLGFATYDEDGNYAGLEEMPTIDLGGCVYLMEDGTYEAADHDREELDAAYVIFLDLLELHRWLKEHK